MSRLVIISKDGQMLACTSNYGVVAEVLGIKKRTVPSILVKAEKNKGYHNGFYIDFMEDHKMVAHCGKLGIRIDTGEKLAVLCDKCCYKDSPVDCVNRVECELGSYYYEPKLMVKEDFLLRKIRALPKLNFKVRKTIFGYEAFRDGELVGMFEKEKEAINALKALHKKAVLKYIDIPKERYYYRGFLLAASKDIELNQVLARRIIERLM